MNKFYTKREGGFSVEVFSKEESRTNEPMILGVYDGDVKELIDSLNADPVFVEMTQKVCSPEDIRKMIEIVLCHHTRTTVRKYGIGHN